MTIAQEVFDELADIIADGLQPQDFLSICACVMRILQSRRELRGKGQIKKTITREVFNILLNDTSVIDDDTKILLKQFIDSSLSLTINALKSLAKSIYTNKKLVFCC